MPKTVIPADLPRKKTRKTATLSEPTVFQPSITMRKQLENLRQFFIRKPKPSKKAPVPPKKYIKRSYQPVADREL